MARGSIGCGRGSAQMRTVSRAEAFADQDSSLVSVFANADALVRRVAGAPALAAGELIEALALGRA